MRGPDSTAPTRRPLPAKRARVLAVLQAAPAGLRTAEICVAAGFPGGNNADQLLRRMMLDGQLERVRYGLYRLPETLRPPASGSRRR
jgi:hypothetical protein